MEQLVHFHFEKVWWYEIRNKSVCILGNGDTEKVRNGGDAKSCRKIKKRAYRKNLNK